MLAQVFNPTEIKKNGPATRPAIAPARRVASLLKVGGVALPGTRPKLMRHRCTVNRCRSVRVYEGFLDEELDHQQSHAPARRGC